VKYVGTTAVNLTVVDLAGNGYVGSGDYFTFAAVIFAPGSYSAVLIYIPTGEDIGIGASFYVA
jgi:hypothetical protein